MNPEKCQLFRKEVRYLGQIVSASGVTTDPEKLEAVKSWPRPNDKQLRSFLGLCTYYRRFISGFADIAKPLTKLTEEKQTYEWSTDAETAFQALEALCTAPVLGYRDHGRSSPSTPTPATWELVYSLKYKMAVSGWWPTSVRLSKAERNYL